MPALSLRPANASCAAALSLMLAACATVPGGPSLPALPGSQQGADQFAADDGRCRALVSQRLAEGTPTGATDPYVAGSAASQGAWAGTQQQFDAAYYACMYAAGHKVPVPAGQVASYRAWFESVTPRPAPGEALPRAR